MMLDDMKEKKELYAEMKERARDGDNWKTSANDETNDDDVCTAHSV